ncbi:hypothetical protein [Alkalibacter saccharofermentans]|uniref:hypothetical protein n=1 Tax=Alkalibacter saccharofermentans TaxID=235931 RepID=UPI00116087DB|nr:hypothetical protein [Alkalibacter saccharofermentans]
MLDICVSLKEKGYKIAIGHWEALIGQQAILESRGNKIADGYVGGGYQVGSSSRGYRLKSKQKVKKS